MSEGNAMKRFEDFYVKININSSIFNLFGLRIRRNFQSLIIKSQRRYDCGFKFSNILILPLSFASLGGDC